MSETDTEKKEKLTLQELQRAAEQVKKHMIMLREQAVADTQKKEQKKVEEDKKQSTSKKEETASDTTLEALPLEERLGRLAQPTQNLAQQVQQESLSYTQKPSNPLLNESTSYNQQTNNDAYLKDKYDSQHEQETTQYQQSTKIQVEKIETSGQKLLKSLYK